MELLRDRRADFDEVGVQPVGISRDSPYTHIAWTQALDLNFGLLSDFNGDAVRGIRDRVRVPRLPGRRARRSAFLVDGDGVIRHAWSYETGDVPDVEEWLEAAREVESSRLTCSIDRWTHLQQVRPRRLAARTTSRTRSSPASSSSARSSRSRDPLRSRTTGTRCSRRCTCSSRSSGSAAASRS